MLIFYNFYILLATFYTIFGTNILIHCPVPVLVCCMFYVSQKIHIKWSPNGIKTNGDFFLEYLWFLGRRINAMRCPRGPRGRGRALDPRGHPVRRLEPFFRRKKANFWIKIVSKIQPNRSYGSPVIKETVKGQNPERRNRERQRDRSNLGGALAPPTPWRPWTRGETLLPSKEKVKEEEEEGGLPLPPPSGGAGMPPGAIIITAIYTNNFTALITNSYPSM